MIDLSKNIDLIHSRNNFKDTDIYYQQRYFQLESLKKKNPKNIILTFCRDQRLYNLLVLVLESKPTNHTPKKKMKIENTTTPIAAQKRNRE